MLLTFYITLFVFLFVAYTFIAGAVECWLHYYLLSTSKTSEYSHDHRMCVFTSWIWPIPVLVLIGIYTYKSLIKIYKFPHIIYLDVQKRRKQLQSTKV